MNNVNGFVDKVLRGVRLSMPIAFKDRIKSIIYNFKLGTIQRSYQDILEEVKKKEKIKVVFFLIHDSVWKYEEIYSLMEKDERFDPLVVICPYVSYGEENMLKDMNQAFDSFSNRGYRVVKTYNERLNSWLDVKKEIEPDIVFFTNPHELTRPEYYIYNFLDTLTCYVPYACVVIHSIEMHYNQAFHKHLWKHFVETVYHQKFAFQYLPKTVRNVSITGYPSLDKVFNKDYIPKSVWKEIKDSQKTKKIIWAPHHTIEGQGSGLDYSSFMGLSEFIINYLKSNTQIQIAFKPHPLLKIKLYNDENWGIEKTDNYYNSWNEMQNGQLEESDYIDLFFTSDALILDSASFMMEYLYTKKPSLFTVNDSLVRNRFNEFGQIVYDHLYHAENKIEIENFIESVVLNSDDPMFDQRMHLLENVILPKNKETASMNIFSQIKKELN